MTIKKLSYMDIPPALRAKTSGEAQRRLQMVLSDPAATPEQKELARRHQGVLRQWASGTMSTDAKKQELDDQIPVSAAVSSQSEQTVESSEDVPAGDASES